MTVLVTNKDIGSAGMIREWESKEIRRYLLMAHAHTILMGHIP